MDYISYNYLIDEVSLREVPLMDSVIDLINPDREKALKSFDRLVRAAVREYDNHHPLCITKTFSSLSSSGYTFIDNFEAYIAGNISESEIELVPEAIAVLGNGWFNYPTANTWRYKKPTLIGVGGTTNVKYYAFHPVRSTISADGDFTEDSRVYYISEKDNTFINLVAYNVLNYLKQTRESVIQPTGVQFFDFSQRLQDLRASINDDFSVSAEVYQTWAMGWSS